MTDLTKIIDEMLATEPVSAVYDKIGQSLRYDIEYITIDGGLKDRFILISKEDWKDQVLPDIDEMLVDELENREGKEVELRDIWFLSDDENDVDESEVIRYYIEKLLDMGYDIDDNDEVYIGTIVTDWYNKNIG